MTGYVYYDVPYGSIKSVSMRPVDGMDFPVVEVEDDIALSFLSGATEIWSWTVDADLKLVSMASLRMNLYWRNGWETLPRTTGTIEVVISTSPSSQYAEVTLNAPERMTIESTVTDRFRFVFTEKGHPDGILASIDVPIRDLNENRSAIIHVPGLPAVFDILTLAFDDVAYRHAVVETVSPVIPLPRGRFEDVVPMRRGTPEGSSLVAFVEDDHLHVRILAGGGPRYDRGREFLRVAVCSRNNPDHLIEMFHVDLEQLQAGDFSIPFSHQYREVDLFTDLMYRDAFFSECSCDTQ